MGSLKKPAKKQGTRVDRKNKRVQAADATAAALLELIEGEQRARLMADVPEFRAVPSVLRSFNRATTIGGLPLGCLCLLHGPSAGGKTALALAMIASFQRCGGLAALIDAEFSAETKRWFPVLIDPTRCAYYGRAPDKHLPPMSYEEVVTHCDRLLERFRMGKRKGRIRKDMPLIVVVDSVSKLVPASLLTRMQKEGGSGLSSGVGRLQAMLNTAWLAELGPKVGDGDILFVVIAHELEVATSQPGRWTQDYKIRGGGALVYDSMMACRVRFGGRVTDATTDGAPLTAKRHIVSITKNKHGPGWAESVFYVSTGAGIAPIGFDLVRETVHEGIRRGLVEGPKLVGKALTMGARLRYAGKNFSLRSLYGSGKELVDAIGRQLDEDVFEKPAPAPAAEASAEVA